MRCTKYRSKLVVGVSIQRSNVSTGLKAKIFFFFFFYFRGFRSETKIDSPYAKRRYFVHGYKIFASIFFFFSPFFFLYLQSREKWEIHVRLLVFPASDVGSLDKLSAEQGGEEIRVQRQRDHLKKKKTQINGDQTRPIVTVECRDPKNHVMSTTLVIGKIKLSLISRYKEENKKYKRLSITIR